MDKHVCRFCGHDQTDAIATSLTLCRFIFWLLLFHKITYLILYTHIAHTQKERTN